MSTSAVEAEPFCLKIIQALSSNLFVFSLWALQAMRFQISWTILWLNVYFLHLLFTFDSVYGAQPDNTPQIWVILFILESSFNFNTRKFNIFNLFKTVLMEGFCGRCAMRGVAFRLHWRKIWIEIRKKLDPRRFSPSLKFEILCGSKFAAISLIKQKLHRERGLLPHSVVMRILAPLALVANLATRWRYLH